MLKGFAHASRHHQHRHDRFRRGDTIITLDGKIETVGVASASGRAIPAPFPHDCATNISLAVAAHFKGALLHRRRLYRRP
jgi:hypothetical protein